MSESGERRVTLEDAHQSVQARLVSTFATVVRLLHDGLGWRVQFVAATGRISGQPPVSPIAEAAGIEPIVAPPTPVISEPVVLDTGEVWGRLWCHQDAGVAFGKVGPRVLRVLAQVIAAETDANMSRRAALDAGRSQVQAIIRERRLRCAFQPIVELQSMQTVGFEALARFDDPTYDTAEWFRRAAAVGLDLELELVAATVALGHADQIPAHLFLAINASPALIMDDRFACLVDGAQRRLVIEITENRVIEAPESLDARLCGLRRQGVRLAIDDAGAGYAGLQRLVELRPEIVKLDLTLIRGIDDDIARTALALAMVGFCRATGAQLVAEGIETPAELERLVELGIDLGQGYLLGRPAPLPVDPCRGHPTSDEGRGGTFAACASGAGGGELDTSRPVHDS